MQGRKAGAWRQRASRYDRKDADSDLSLLRCLAISDPNLVFPLHVLLIYHGAIGVPHDKPKLQTSVRCNSPAQTDDNQIANCISILAFIINLDVTFHFLYWDERN
jgi:hypothetical protein